MATSFLYGGINARFFVWLFGCLRKGVPMVSDVIGRNLETVPGTQIPVGTNIRIRE